MEALKQEIQDWFNSGCSYDSGVALFEKYGTQKTLLKNFSRLRTPLMGDRLAYELCIIGGLDENILIDAVVSFADEPAKNVKFTTAIPVNKEWPEEVTAIIKKRNKAGHERAKLHNQIVEVHTTNTKDNMAKRRDLLARINDLTVEYDALDGVVKKYMEDGIIDLSTISKQTDEPPKTTTEQGGGGENIVGNKYISACDSKSDVELTKYLSGTLRPMVSKTKKQLEALAEGEKKDTMLVRLKELEEAVIFVNSKTNGK